MGTTHKEGNSLGRGQPRGWRLIPGFQIVRYLLVFPGQRGEVPPQRGDGFQFGQRSETCGLLAVMRCPHKGRVLDEARDRAAFSTKSMALISCAATG